MITATLQEAKAKLNRLVDKARSGETVVLMRGSEIVAEIRPLSADDLEVSPRLSDRQAEHFWREVEQEKSGVFATPTAAVSFLKKTKK